MTTDAWQESQRVEAAWWGDCTNTYMEETKQLVYANRIGLMSVTNPDDGGHYPLYDLKGKSILDVGGGPVSILLKTIQGGRMVVLDPCWHPEWVTHRYMSHGIGYLRIPAEKYVLGYQPFDEAWIYNVLQHVQDPEQVVAAARQSANLVRVFEWMFIDPYEGHPHRLDPDSLNRWLDGVGTVETMSEPWCLGANAYYGVFPSG